MEAALNPETVWAAYGLPLEINDVLPDLLRSTDAPGVLVTVLDSAPDYAHRACVACGIQAENLAESAWVPRRYLGAVGENLRPLWVHFDELWLPSFKPTVEDVPREQWTTDRWTMLRATDQHRGPQGDLFEKFLGDFLRLGSLGFVATGNTGLDCVVQERDYLPQVILERWPGAVQKRAVNAKDLL